ncbi:hypothetical protein O1611_g4076 [Lasiodiplodia mahajangana]|uniref:Uncharacterized protein n=1 Tax=Lasiodiplodia mahajangana TaxID=1108764 RepID=A0ACC2JQ85_9PEZI|nr:hypothetical protein O1611_g4076 [Lasiodiplodia mahajangana]
MTSHDEDSPPTGGTPPSTSPGLGTTTTSISSQSTVVAAPTTTLVTTTSKLAKEPSTTSTASLATTSLALTSSQAIPLMPTNTLLPSVSTTPSSLATLVVPTSSAPVSIPGDLTTSTSVIPHSTGSAQLSPSTDLSQPANFINPTDESQGSTSDHSQQRAGQIAGGVVGGIAFIGLVLLAIWMWRRRRNRDNYLSRMSAMPPDDTQYPVPQPRAPGNYRSPSSIMNQLMTAAYAAEDGRSYRDSDGIFDNYANEKQAFAIHENESTERLTIPASAQLRPPSIAARTETTSRTESTWKTWGVLAGSSRLPAPKNWWVDRYFRT